MISCRLLPQALEQMWSTKTLDHWIITTYITTTKSTSEPERDAGAAEKAEVEARPDRASAMWNTKTKPCNCPLMQQFSNIVSPYNKIISRFLQCSAFQVQQNTLLKI